MKAPKLVSQAMRSMRRYQLRTVLMVLGIVVGIASLTVLSSIGEATKRETMQRFKNMIGTFDTIIIRPGGGRSRGMPTLVNVPPTLRFEDANAIARDLPEIRAVAEMQTAFDVDIKYRDHAASPTAIRTTPNSPAFLSHTLHAPPSFTEEQNQARTPV